MGHIFLKPVLHSHVVYVAIWKYTDKEKIPQTFSLTRFLKLNKEIEVDDLECPLLA